MTALARRRSRVSRLAACGEKQESLSSPRPEPFDLALDFYVNPDHAGIYTALADGYFERAGLDVTPQVPSDPSAPIKEVAAGRADLAVSYEPEVLLAREQGLEVEAVAALVDEPLTSLISLPAGGVASAADLQGKTVATAGIPYQDDYLQTILQGAGLSLSDVTEVNVGLNLLPALLGGQAAGDPRRLQEHRGRGPRPARREPDRRPGESARRPHLRRAGPGGEALHGRGRPGEPPAVHRRARPRDQGRDRQPRRRPPRDILNAGQGLDPKLTAAEMDATLPLLAAAPGHPYGQMDAAKWQLFAQLDGRPRADHERSPEPTRCSRTSCCRRRAVRLRARRRPARRNRRFRNARCRVRLSGTRVDQLGGSAWRRKTCGRASWRPDCSWLDAAARPRPRRRPLRRRPHRAPDHRLAHLRAQRGANPVHAQRPVNRRSRSAGGSTPQADGVLTDHRRGPALRDRQQRRGLLAEGAQRPQRWQRQVARRNASAPTYSDGRLYISNLEPGQVIALDANNGQSSGGNGSGPHRVLTAGRRRPRGGRLRVRLRLRAQRLNGNPLWRAGVGGAVKASPAYDDGVVYVGDYGGAMNAIRIDDGRSSGGRPTSGASTRPPQSPSATSTPGH